MNRPPVPALVVKRDGRLVPFDADKIASAIARAGAASGEFGTEAAAPLLQTGVLPRLQALALPGIEQIQDAVEAALFDAGHRATLRAYTVYREQHARLRDAQRSLVDVQATMDEYLQQRDWRIHANANQGYSLGGLILNVSGKVVANHWLDHVYPPAVGRAHREADIHIHDLDMLSGYCAGWSLRTLQNEWAGAQAFSSFDTYLAPFVRKDALSYAQVRQCMQELVYNLNVPSRWGTQTPFTNLTFDWTCPDDLKTQVPVIAGQEQPFTYGELQAEMDLINRAYIEVMSAGDAKGRVFTFPIPTDNITREFDWHSPNAEALFAMTARYGLPYFQNFVNSDLEPHMVRSMCCRLQLDLRELLKRGNGLFGSAEQTGSVGVVTVNCARLGFLHAGDEAALMARLDALLELGRQSLEIKRKFIQRLMDQGLFPYTKRYLGTLRNHFSTLGVNGLNEMVRNFSGDADDITTPAGEALALRLLERVRERMVQFQEQTGHLYNLEATPAEGTTYRFAKEDRKRFPAILQAGTEQHPYYTNSSQLPVGFTEDPFEALARQEPLQRLYTGGTVLHLYMSEPLSGADACRQLVRRALSNFRLPYVTVTPTFSICPTHGYLAGRHDFCPRCDEERLAHKRRALATPTPTQGEPA